MKVAIHAAELDYAYFNGVRVYTAEVVKRLHALAPDVTFELYHKDRFNAAFGIPAATNYVDRQLKPSKLWTQTTFAFSLFRHNPDILWMPVHNLPRLRPSGMKSVVTIHDLAWKYYPETFPPTLRKKLETHTSYAIKHADHIITVSHATRSDIVKFYPKIKEQKISVVPLGVDLEVIPKDIDHAAIVKHLGVSKEYVLCLGTVQPRKNFVTAIEAFEKMQEKGRDMQLVIAGGDGWLAGETHERAEASPFAADIIFTGGISEEQKWSLLFEAEIFVYPSLYEGFGISVLEALATLTPTIVANNSSLPEVAGDAALIFDATNSDDLVAKIERILNNGNVARDLAVRGERQVKDFTWDHTAKGTIEALRLVQVS